ncbi:SDR family oxidoreductase [Algiphilus sp.]|uniref:SDR family oxidoreductase n=1 Tax=Algiphilus sp. TaxID=1872431 RepID=UPI003B520ECF
MQQTIVITGANRGIGLELARQWQQRGERVIAVVRAASDALKALDLTVIEGIDVSRDDHMPALRAALVDTAIDTLYLNAGVMRSESLDDMDFDRIRDQFEINTLGPLRVVCALLPRMREGGKIGLMTSRMGSIADNDSGAKYGYRISKAGLNAAGKSLAVDLAPRGIAVAILHPGFVRTEMTNGNGHIDPPEAAERLIQRMDGLTLEHTGTFWHSDGSVLPW